MSIDARTTNGLTDFFYLLEIAAQDLYIITFLLPQRLYQLSTETVCIPKVSKSKSHCTLKVLMYFCLVAKVVRWFLKAAKKNSSSALTLSWQSINVEVFWCFAPLLMVSTRLLTSAYFGYRAKPSSKGPLCSDFPNIVQKSWSLNIRFLRERDMASNPKMEYQIFLCIFQKNSASQTETANWADLFHYLPSQRNFLISFKPKVAMAKFVWKMQKKSLVFWKVGVTPCLFSS